MPKKNKLIKVDEDVYLNFRGFCISKKLDVGDELDKLMLWRLENEQVS